MLAPNSRDKTEPVVSYSQGLPIVQTIVPREEGRGSQSHLQGPITSIAGCAMRINVESMQDQRRIRAGKRFPVSTVDQKTQTISMIRFVTVSSIEFVLLARLSS